MVRANFSSPRCALARISFHRSLAQQRELEFAHGALQSKEQSVITPCRVVDPIGIDDQSPRQAAQLKQMVPVPTCQI